MTEKVSIQQQVRDISIPNVQSLYSFPGVPDSFRPWECGLSPSALYQSSLSCRKRMKMKTPEVKWISIKRWVTTTPGGIELPPGVFLSVKRKEDYVALPKPHFAKLDFVLMMFPFGNVWSQRALDVPITEEWLFQGQDGRLILEHLMIKDATSPVKDYFKGAYALYRHEFEKNEAGKPSLLWIHTKRRERSDTKT